MNWKGIAVLFGIMVETIREKLGGKKLNEGEGKDENLFCLLEKLESI